LKRIKEVASTPTLTPALQTQHSPRQCLPFPQADCSFRAPTLFVDEIDTGGFNGFTQFLLGVFAANKFTVHRHGYGLLQIPDAQSTLCVIGHLVPVVRKILALFESSESSEAQSSSGARDTGVNIRGLAGSEARP
jgi:hypothetical protein